MYLPDLFSKSWYIYSLSKFRFWIFILFSLCLFSQTGVCKETKDVIHLKDGSTVTGEIIEIIPNDKLTIITDDNSTATYFMSEIEKISKDSKSPRDLINSSYTELGATLGTPAGINLNIGYMKGKIGFRFSGMYYNHTNGLQIAIVNKISDNTKRSHTIALVAGTSEVGYRDWDYIGAAYQLNLSGFYLELGLSAGDGYYSSPQATLQIGYVNRFIK